MDVATYLVHKTLKSDECLNSVDFLHADCDAIIFLLDEHCTLYLWQLQFNYSFTY